MWALDTTVNEAAVLLERNAGSSGQIIPQNEHDSTSGAKTRSGLHKRPEIGRQNKHRAIILGPTDTRNNVEVSIGGLNQIPRSSPVRTATLRAKVVEYVESAGSARSQIPYRRNKCRNNAVVFRR